MIPDLKKTMGLLRMSDSLLNKIGFGAWQIGGANWLDGKNLGWSTSDEKESITSVQKAYDFGIRFFDTAFAYGQGRSELILGEALAGKNDVSFCTKIGPKIENGKMVSDFSDTHLDYSLKTSLSRLRRKQLEVLLLHGPTPEDITPAVIDKLESYKRQGLVGAIGISVPFIAPFQSSMDVFDAFELLYNPVTKQNETAITALKGKQVFLRSIFASGLLLKPLSFFEETASLKDWRVSMPKVVFDQAQQFAFREPDIEKRYHMVLNEMFSLDVDQIIIGISAGSQLLALQDWVKGSANAI